MASVFLSYDRDDTAKAAEIAAALENASHSVWWDQRIRGGAQYSKEIEQALEFADAVVVLWSKSSVESAWVRDEAAEGRDRAKLVPVSIDSAKPPIGFRQFQTIDLSKGGRARSSGQQRLVRAVEDLSRPAEEKGPQLNAPAPVRKKPRRVALIGGGAVVVIAAGALLLFANPFATSAESEVSAAVTPLDASAESKALSDDLITKLALFTPQDGGAFRLVDQGPGSGAALLFRVGASSDATAAHANLLLLDGKSSAVLWSGQFERPAAASGDLRQEMGYTAAQVLECALQGYRSSRLASKINLLKSYLDGCAAQAGSDPGEPEAQVLRFRKLVQAAPDFDGGWAELLLAETNVGRLNSDQRQQLAQDIVRARKLRPEMPEAYVAEVALLPDSAYGSALELMDRGLKQNPASSLLLELRSSLLFSVGRTSDAVADARRAAEVDPASPVIRNNYIYTLAHSGRTKPAFDEIAKAERFWPGATEIARTKYILNSRYGDPAAALAYVESSAYDGDVPRTRIYLEARARPTPANIDRAIAVTREGLRADDPQSAAALMQVLGMFGRQDDLIDLLMGMPVADLVPIQDILFRPTMRILWLDPRSLELAKRLGLMQYWNSSGKWPDFCSQPNFPYDCKKEAAKLLA